MRNIESGDSFPFMKYWFNNSGVLPMFVLFAGWIAFGIVETRFFEAFFMTFVVLNFVKLQDNEDYNIFGFYSFLYTLGAIYYIAIATRIYKRAGSQEAKGVMLGIFFVVTIFFSVSSIMSVRQIIHFTNSWNGKNDIIEWVMHNTGKNDVFLSNDVVLNPISTCAGRIMYISSAEVLEREGFSSGQAYEDKSRMLGNENVLKNVRYYVELSSLQNSFGFADGDAEKWEQLYHSSAGSIYRNKMFDN